ncbi:MAG: cytochrome-c peroxidase [Planctomycetota bacterium]
MRNTSAAIQLGKALFWDMQAGSDGVQACASCHFHAGADNRVTNTLNPGLLAGDGVFSVASANGVLGASSFPFHRLLDPTNSASEVLSDSNDVTSSQGVVLHSFTDIVPGSAVEQGTLIAESVFQVGGVNVRRVEPRNTPTVVNAVFNHRNLWDGRGQDVFNGVNHLGARDQAARVLQVVNGTLTAVVARIESSSLASQATGPPRSFDEMVFAGRDMPKLGKKLLGLKPLAKQLVARDDSVLGGLAASATTPGAKGLKTTYVAMIKAAFQPAFHSSTSLVTFPNGVATISSRTGPPLTTDEFTQMEANFALFWGLSIQLYEATLVSDQTPFDLFVQNKGALTAEEQAGLELFVGKARCFRCHGGPEFTNASANSVSLRKLIRMTVGDGQVAVYDNGFYNIGVRPTADDPGAGGLDSFGNPLSLSRMALLGQFNDPSLSPPIEENERVVVDGAFKVPQLRNVELTGPYFHNGGQATLRQVIDFYDRGGDFAEANIANLDRIAPIGLTETEKQSLVAFLSALTDPRVRFQKAPFDHPQIFVPNGHVGSDVVVQDDGTGQAVDVFLEVPAVGKNGGSALPTFLGLSPRQQ